MMKHSLKPLIMSGYLTLIVLCYLSIYDDLEITEHKFDQFKQSENCSNHAPIYVMKINIKIKYKENVMRKFILLFLLISSTCFCEQDLCKFVPKDVSNPIIEKVKTDYPNDPLTQKQIIDSQLKKYLDLHLPCLNINFKEEIDIPKIIYQQIVERAEKECRESPWMQYSLQCNYIEREVQAYKRKNKL